MLFVCGCRTPEGKDKGKKLLLYSGIGIAIQVVFRLIVLAAQG